MIIHFSLISGGKIIILGGKQRIILKNALKNF